MLDAKFVNLPDLPLLAALVILGAVTYFLTLKIARINELDEALRLAGDIVKPYVETIRNRSIKRPAYLGPVEGHHREEGDVD